MAETSRTVRVFLALGLALAMLSEAATAWAQAAPPAGQAPAPAYPGNAPPPAATPSYPPQQQYPQQQYPQQQYPQQQQYQQPQVQPPQGAPPPAGYTPQQSPLVGQPVQPVQPGYGQPGYVQPPVQWRPPQRARPRRGLMIAGISVFGGVYLLSTFIGSALLDEDSNHNDIGGLLFIPLAGPFLSMSRTDSGDWGLWWLGMGQAAGLGMMVGGIIQYVNSKRRAEAQGFAQWQLPGDRKLSLDMSTSPHLAGPRVRLSF